MANQGQSPNQDDMKNWIDCMPNLGTPSAPLELKYCSAQAVQMADLSYKRTKRMALKKVRSIQPEHA